MQPVTIAGNTCIKLNQSVSFEFNFDTNKFDIYHNTPNFNINCENSDEMEISSISKSEAYDKLSSIENLLLKFVATNQSLYI